MDDEESLWRKIFLNEIVLASVAALVILYVAFQLATSGETLDDGGKPVRAARP
jgi:hypothetical protein